MASNVASILDYCLHDFILSELTGAGNEQQYGMGGSSIAISGINSSGSTLSCSTSYYQGQSSPSYGSDYDPIIEIDRPSVIVRNEFYKH